MCEVQARDGVVEQCQILRLTRRSGARSRAAAAGPHGLPAGAAAGAGAREAAHGRAVLAAVTAGHRAGGAAAARGARRLPRRAPGQVPRRAARARALPTPALPTLDRVCSTQTRCCLPHTLAVFNGGVPAAPDAYLAARLDKLHAELRVRRALPPPCPPLPWEGVQRAGSGARAGQPHAMALPRRQCAGRLCASCLLALVRSSGPSCSVQPRP